MDILFLQVPPATTMVEAPSWGKALGGLIGGVGVIWLVVLLVMVIILSRWSNKLEVSGTKRAESIARSTVSVFMWFFVLPLTLFILINIFAIVNGLGAINIIFFGKWLGLTFSSYWWLIQCATGADAVQGELANYSPDAVIRLIWIFLPLSFIWLRSISTSWLRWMLIPIIIGSLVVTRHKKAGETFITADVGVENLRKLPVIGSLFDPPATVINGQPTQSKGFSPTVRKILASTSAAVMCIGVAVALYFAKRAIGLVIILIGLGGFLFIAPSSVNKELKKLAQDKDHAININIDSLVQKLHEFKQSNNEMELYYTAQKLKDAYKAQVEFVKFPDSLCRDYKDYFYDRCR